MLMVERLSSGYGRIEVLHEVSLRVQRGQIAAIVGANGAGKSTLLRAISGVQSTSGGRILFDGSAIEALPAHARVRLGIALVPEGRQVFAPLSVEDNLRLGAWSRRKADLAADIERIYKLFPMLDPLRGVSAGMLSGGQQQMLAIGRALMARPRLLLLDEPSMGLAPIITKQIFLTIQGLKQDGTALLLVEQNASAALAVADTAYVLETGRVTLCGSAIEIRSDNRVQQAYLGV